MLRDQIRALLLTLAAVLVLVPTGALADGTLTCKGLKSVVAVGGGLPANVYSSAFVFVNPNEALTLSVDRVRVYDHAGALQWEQGPFSLQPLTSVVLQTSDFTSIGWAESATDVLLVQVRWSFVDPKSAKGKPTPLDLVSVTAVYEGGTGVVRARTSYECKPVL